MENALALYLFRRAAFGTAGHPRQGTSPQSNASRVPSETDPRCQATPETDPLATGKLTPLLINGTAPTGLSTLCPRRRSPDNQVAVGKGWVTPSTALADGSFQVVRDAACGALFELGLQSSHDGQPVGRNIAPIKLGPEVADVRRTGVAPRIEHRPFQAAELRFPPFAHRASVSQGDRRRGRSVENARRPVLFSGAGRHSRAAPAGSNTARFNRHGTVRRSASILLTYTVVGRTLSRVRSTDR